MRHIALLIVLTSMPVLHGAGLLATDLLAPNLDGWLEVDSMEWKSDPKDRVLASLPLPPKAEVGMAFTLYFPDPVHPASVKIPFFYKVWPVAISCG